MIVDTTFSSFWFYSSIKGLWECGWSCLFFQFFLVLFIDESGNVKVDAVNYVFQFFLVLFLNSWLTLVNRNVLKIFQFFLVLFRSRRTRRGRIKEVLGTFSSFWFYSVCRILLNMVLIISLSVLFGFIQK